jgi:quercetin dioxygenase-like cupin family protein
MPARKPAGDCAAAESSAKKAVLGRPAGPAGLIEYQKGAVVSRELLRKPGGTLTLFAFDQGQGLSEHTAPFDAAVLIVDGEAEVSIARKPRRVKAGQLILMPANKPHALQAVRPFKMLLIMIRG